MAEPGLDVLGVFACSCEPSGVSVTQVVDSARRADGFAMDGLDHHTATQLDAIVATVRGTHAAQDPSGVCF